MSFNTNPVKEWASREYLTPARMNEHVRRFNQSLREVADNLLIDKNVDLSRAVRQFPAIIRADGGSPGIKDYSDSRYWLDVGIPDPTLAWWDKLNAVAPAIAGKTTIITATNLAELKGSSHVLRAGDIVYVFGYPTRHDPAITVYLFHQFHLDGVITRVDLTQDNGAGHAGDVSTLCSYTYTAKFIGTTNVIGTSMSPEASIMRGYPCKAAAATQGQVYWHNGTPTLTLAYETSGNKACS